MNRNLAFFLAACGLLIAPRVLPAAIDCPIVFPADGASLGVKNTLGVTGMDLADFNGIDLICTTDNPPLVDVFETTLTFDGGGGPPDCTETATPALEECGWVINGADTVRVVYNGLLPTEEVTVSITNVEDNDGATTSRNWSFTPSVSRDPVAIELVFDISGSMGWPTVPLGSVDRIVASRSAAQYFFDVLKAYSIPGDQLGAIYFSTTAAAFDPGSDDNLKDATDDTAVDAVQADLEAQSPTFSTSIGAGLDKANSDEGFGDPLPTIAKYVLLFSDGEQNRAPLVSVVGDTLRTDIFDYPEGITVCPITAGRMAAPGHALQQEIAVASCDGRNAVIDDSEETFVQTDLETFFVQDLADILVGDKLEVAVDVRGAITARRPVVHAFLANPQDLSMSILLSWFGAGPGEVPELPFDLVAPDGTVVDLTGKTRPGTNMSSTLLRLPAVSDGSLVPAAGVWTIRLRDASVPLDYHLMVLLDNAGLASEYGAAIDDPGTGEPFPVRVTLREGTTPILDASVVAGVSCPRGALGEILSGAPNPTSPPAPADSGVNDAYYQKLRALLDDPRFADLFANCQRPQFVLEDQGGDGDEVAGDGVYSGVFHGADVEGHYHFVFDVEGTARVNGDFQRTRRLTVFVRPKPDPARTDFEIIDVQKVDDVTWKVRLSATPRDAAGNRLGPGYLDAIDLRASLGTAEGEIIDRLDGSYEIVFLIPAGSNPEVTVEVMEEDVITEDLEDLPGSDLLDPPVDDSDWQLSFHAGGNRPHGIPGRVFDGGSSLGLDLERLIRGPFSVEIFLGHDRFDPKVGAGDQDVSHLSGHAKWTFGEGRVRPSIHLGAGLYLLEDSELEVGENAGVSVQYQVRPGWALEVSWNYRNIAGGDLEYETLTLGARLGL